MNMIPKSEAPIGPAKVRLIETVPCMMKVAAASALQPLLARDVKPMPIWFMIWHQGAAAEPVGWCIQHILEEKNLRAGVGVQITSVDVH